jgi:hypothetical protein
MDDETAARRKRIEKELAELRGDLEKSRKAVGIESGELQRVTAIALSRFGVDLGQNSAVRGKNVATFTLDPDHEAFANDPTWALAFDDIRVRRRRKGEKPHVWRREAPVRALSFESPIKEDGTDLDDVAHLHLEHRLVRRLLAQFLSYGFQSALNRATVISSPASQPRVILLGRLTLFGPGAARLHGEIIPVTATWTDADRAKQPLKVLSDRTGEAVMRELEQGLALGRQPTDAIIKRLTATAPLDIRDLRPPLEARAQECVTRETAELTKIGASEAKSLRELLEAQRKQIIAREKTAAAPEFDLGDDRSRKSQEEESRQFELDRRHWTRKIERLEHDIVEEPKRLIDGYVIRAHRLEPVGLVYLWPQTN